MSQKFTVDDTGPRIAALLNNIIGHAAWDLSFVIAPGNAALATEFESPDITVKFSGGDVDLLLELDEAVAEPAQQAARLAALASRAMYGRKVDVLIKAPNLKLLPIHSIALAEGIRL